MKANYGKWSVVGTAYSDERRRSYVRCRCECGTERDVQVSGLESGKTTMCKACSNRLKNQTRILPNRKHPLYTVWYSMKQRCLNPNSPAYANYGGRGISVCDTWLEYDPFFNWCITNGYAPGLEIDRIDNGEGYSPENCRFVTSQVNNNNKRSNVVLDAWGETKAIAEWVQNARCAVRPKLLQERIREGWTPELAISTSSLGRFTGYRVRPN